MTANFRVAGFSAVAFCVAATTVAIDPSLAVSGTSAPIVASTLNVSSTLPVPALAVEPAALLDSATVIFAPRKEVVQQSPAVQPNAEAPTVRPASLAHLVAAQTMPETLDRDLECLAGAVYFEAKSESHEGQLAVAEVIINRSKSGRFPGSVCSVVMQPSQFSFVRRGGFPPIRKASRAWTDAVAIATIALKSQWESSVSDALFFHASRVSPNWRKTRIAQLGNHVFYR